jgi:hypothetical protein
MSPIWAELARIAARLEPLLEILNIARFDEPLEYAADVAILFVDD